MRRLRRLRLTWRATAIALACLALLWAIIAAGAPAPLIEQRIGDTTLRFSADRAWALLPGDCVTAQWQVEGIESLYVEGQGVVGKGEQPFCPSARDRTARFDVRTPDGLYRQYELRVHFLPDLLIYLAAFVGATGSLALIAFFIIAHRLDRALNPRWVALAFAALVLMGTALRVNEPLPPRLDAIDGPVKVAMWADKSSLVVPRECADIGLSVVGAQSVRHEGEKVALRGNHGRIRHCDYSGRSATLHVVGADGSERRHELGLPALWASLADTPFYWYVNIAALVVAALLYLPMIVEKARNAWLRQERSDFAALGGLAAAALILYLPFGFDSIGQMEEWIAKSFFEHRANRIFAPEYPARPFSEMPRILATLIDSESFVGYHIVLCAIIAFQAMLAFGILRKLGARRLYAFLIAALMIAYPINDALLGMRFTPSSSSVMWLLLACFCALDWLESRRRRTLGGCAAALLFSVGAYESGLALVLVLPFVLWLRPGKACWRRVNLALMFGCAVALKLSWIVLLYATGRPVLYSDRFDGLFSTGALPKSQSLASFADMVADVYLRITIGGWRDAVAALAVNDWWLPTIGAVCCLAAVALYMARQRDDANEPTSRQALLAALGALALALPASSIALAHRGGSLAGEILDSFVRALFDYAPALAAVALVCLLLPLTKRLPDRRKRDLALIGLCMALLLPGMSRLFVIHGALTHSAHAKATVLFRTLEAAPRLEPDSYLLLVTTLSKEELTESDLVELASAAFSAAISLLYSESEAPQGYFCIAPFSCSKGITGKFDWSDHASRWRDTAALELRPDLTVELVDNPAERFNWGISIDYDPQRIVDADAPLPPRARTMLATAWREANS